MQNLKNSMRSGVKEKKRQTKEETTAAVINKFSLFFIEFNYSCNGSLLVTGS